MTKNNIFGSFIINKYMMKKKQLIFKKVSFAINIILKTETKSKKPKPM